MYGLPAQTQVGFDMNKEKKLEKQLEPAQRKQYRQYIQAVQWTHKLAADLLNLAPGQQVGELEVFTLELKTSEVPEVVLRAIDRAISNYHVLFVCHYQARCQLWLAYKECQPHGAPKIVRYYHSDWRPEAEVVLHIEGLDMDAVYAYYLRSLGGEMLAAPAGESLAQTVARSEARQKLDKQIAILQRKMRKAVQLNQQMALRKEIQALRQQRDKI